MIFLRILLISSLTTLLQAQKVVKFGEILFNLEVFIVKSEKKSTKFQIFVRSSSM